MHGQDVGHDRKAQAAAVTRGLPAPCLRIQASALVRVLRDEVAHCADRERLLVLARQWLYDHHLLIVHDRVIRAMVAAALVELEACEAKT